ncbi:MAG: hypothetical protein SPE18_06425 [Candidatus Limivicinus sp.]|nr:hypothetical protein [Candidatus Limivicinus sp.]
MDCGLLSAVVITVACAVGILGVKSVAESLLYRVKVKTYHRPGSGKEKAPGDSGLSIAQTGKL